MKYTPSRDGVDRISVNIQVRLSKQDLVDLKPLAKANGYTSVTKFVRENGSRWIHDGVDTEWEQFNENE